MGQISNTPALVQMMAWCRPGNKPLSESMMVRLPTHICVTRLQRVNAAVYNSQTNELFLPGDEIQGRDSLCNNGY